LTRRDEIIRKLIPKFRRFACRKQFLIAKIRGIKSVKGFVPNPKLDAEASRTNWYAERASARNEIRREDGRQDIEL